MIEFAPADFAPLDDFPLLWRWTSREHDLLAADILATIQPLTALRVASIALTAAARCVERRVVDLDLAISAEWDDPASVRERLGARAVAESDPVIVSWDPQTAVVTRWATFVRHWDAFCYPSSDDVTVWSPWGDWTLCYRHFQVIGFGRHRPAI
jgi:hypothetical protein